MNHKILSLAALAALVISGPMASAAPGGTWGVRLRATYLEMADKSDAFSALGVNFAADAVSVQSKVIPEVDVSYWFTPHLATELVLTIPQQHEVALAGVGNLGTFKHLPPTLLAQYHFRPAAKIRPYIGAGVNFTLIWDDHLKVAGVPLELENSSVGVAAQAGFDLDLGGGKLLNIDVKKAGLRSDVLAGGGRLTTARLDPWVLSLGFGWNF